MQALKTPRGTKDIFGGEVALWQYIEEKIKEICRQFGYGEIRTPVFEHTELFQRGVGETTDVVQKEMYTFMDKGGRSLTLKPEGTAGAARAFIEHKLYSESLPLKIYYVTPLFRYEKPQAGRMRQFHQFGIECYGSNTPAADVEVISLGHLFFERLGLKNNRLLINSLGCKSCRQTYNEALVGYIREVSHSLCPLCKERSEKNPLRVLDCKEKGCIEILKNAPIILDYLDDECRGHFQQVQEGLKALSIPFEVEGRLVRGLDYYTRTVFEFVSSDIGAQSTICGGGRYDGLIEELGGPATGCVGFSVGLERIILALTAQELVSQNTEAIDIFIGAIGHEGSLAAQRLAFDLRRQGINTEVNLMERNVKAQMKQANKLNARFSVIIGDDEIKNNAYGVKNMATGEVLTLTLEQIAEVVGR